MPFTVSHVAAVLPVVGRSGRLPAAALVIGSMAPDYPWFLTRGRTAGLSHSLLGIVTVDLAVGLLAFVLWRRWAQAPVRDLVPRAVGARLPQPPRFVPRDLPWAALGVVLGALTHLVWDSFTHAGRWGVEAVPWLQEGHDGMAGWVWAQDVSSVLGLVVVVVWGVWRLGRTQPDDAGLRSSTTDRQVAWSLVAVGAAGGALVGLLAASGPFVVEVFGAVTLGGAGLAVGVVLACARWWARVSRPAEVAGHRG
jgi:hypothetical protein